MDDFLALFLTTASVSALANVLLTVLFRRGVEPSEAQIKAVESQILPALEEALTKAPEPDPTRRPTKAGEGTAEAIMGAYVRDLMAEASRIARRVGAESPSPKHVELAASRIGILRARASVWTDVLLAFGTLLIGSAASYQINLATGGEAAPHWGVPMALTLAVGVGLSVTGVTLKAKSR